MEDRFMDLLRKIDIHAHPARTRGLPGANGETFPTARELLDMYDAIGIEAGVMLPYINVECAYDTVTNREIAEMAARAMRPAGDLSLRRGERRLWRGG